MALAYLLDPCLQHQNRAGVNNVNGYFEVFEYDTDDRATVYTDFAGTLAPAHIGIDNNGRAVMIVDSAIAYRVEMHAPNGELIYTQAPVWTMASGGGVGGLVKVVSTDGSVDVQKTTVGAVTTYDLSVEGENEPSTWGSKTCSASAINVTGEWVEVPYASSEGSISYNNGWTVTKNCAVDIAASLEMDSGDSDALNNFDVKCEFLKNGSSVLVENGQLDPSKSLDRVCFEYKGAANASDVIDAKIYVRSAESLTVDLVGRAFYNEECDGLIGGGGGGDYEAGEGIDITGDVISIDPTETQEKLTAGDGIIIDNNNEISVDTTAIQEKLEAGDNIVIEGNVISATAALQEQSDWTETDTTDVSYIKHKPSTKPVVAGENITITEETNSFVISATGGQQVQADWSETDSSDPSYIQNKPDLSVYATTQAMDTALAGKQDVISDLAAIRNGAALGATATQPADLAAGLATKQDVISDLATIRSGAALGATSIQPSDLATVATTGSYDDLIDKPVIPAAQVQADWSESESTSVSYIQHKPDLSVYATESELTAGLATKQDTISDLSDIRSGAALGETAVQPSDLATVATTGSYEDLTDKPVIPAAQVQSDWSETDTSDPSYIQNKPDLSVYATDSELTAGLATKQDTISDLANIRSGAAAGETAVQPGDLATVATTGDYDDLSDKPDLSVYATGAELTAGLATKQDTISDLATIRSGAALGATAIQPSDLATVATTGDYTDLSNTPHIPVIGTVTL